MFARRPHTDMAYRVSQERTGVPVHPDAVARGLVMGILGSGEDHRERQRLGQMLIDALDELAGLTACSLVVARRPQVHAHDGQRLQSKTYGYYRCWFGG